jgi:hypothetical protein
MPIRKLTRDLEDIVMVKNKGQAKIEQLKADLQKLEAEGRLRSDEIEQKEAELRRNMVAARVRKDAAAQQMVDVLSKEIADLEGENRQDCGAIQELRAHIETERAELERDRWRSRHDAVLQLLRPRAEGSLERRLVSLAKQMAATAIGLADSDKEIVRALSTLGPAFYSESSQIRYMAVARMNYVSALLSEVVVTPISKSYRETVGEPAAAAVQKISGIMLDVEEAAKIGPEEATAEIPHEVPAKSPTTVAWGGGSGPKLADLPEGETTVVG